MECSIIERKNLLRKGSILERGSYRARFGHGKGGSTVEVADSGSHGFEYEKGTHEDVQERMRTYNFSQYFVPHFNKTVFTVLSKLSTYFCILRGCLRALA